jgi:hypothetical protein
MTTQEWTVKAVKELLKRSDRAVASGLVAIARRQEPDERYSRVTVYQNGVGFSAFDAGFGTSLADQYEERGTLSRKQIEAGRRVILKYAAQLTEIANENAAAKAHTDWEEALPIAAEDREPSHTPLTAGVIGGFDSTRMRFCDECGESVIDCKHLPPRDDRDLEAL